MDEQAKLRAFVVGIMVTKEGFNGECLFDHVAHGDLSDIERSIGDDMENFIRCAMMDETIIRLFNMTKHLL